MNHQEIENDLIFDRYLKGRLTPEEEERFEEHYLGCAECLDQLEAAEGLQRGLRRAVAQDVAEIAAARRLGWLARAARSPGAGVIAVTAIIVAVGLPTWLALQRSEIGQELDQARSEIAEQADRTEALESELTQERETNQALTERLNQQSGVEIYELQRFRGSLLGDPEPAQTITLADSELPFMLSLPLDRQTPGTYRIRLIDASDREILRLEQPLHKGALILSLVSTQLEAGDYVARVEIVVPGAEPAPVARFAFRIAIGG